MVPTVMIDGYCGSTLSDDSSDADEDSSNARAFCIVSAYIHRYCRTLFLLDLIKIIVSYYKMYDEWSQEDKGSHIKILAGLHNTKIFKTFTCYQSILGIEEISEGKFNWKIRVNKLNYIPGSWHIYLGVMNINIQDIGGVVRGNPTTLGCYVFEVTKGVVFNGGDRGARATFETRVKKRDIIEIGLDLNSKSVHCQINGKDIGKYIDKIHDGTYRLLASIYFEETELEIL